MEIIKQEWWKSPVVWTTIFALIAFVTKEWIGFEIPQFDKFVDLLLTAAIAFGIVNSPSVKNALSVK